MPAFLRVTAAAMLSGLLYIFYVEVTDFPRFLALMEIYINYMGYVIGGCFVLTIVATIAWLLVPLVWRF